MQNLTENNKKEVIRYCTTIYSTKGADKEDKIHKNYNNCLNIINTELKEIHPCSKMSNKSHTTCKVNENIHSSLDQLT